MVPNLLGTLNYIMPKCRLKDKNVSSVSTSYNKTFAQGSGEGHKASWDMPSDILQPKRVATVGTLATIVA